MPTLALVVPFYNEQRYLPSLIHSLRGQSATPVPIVFINNRSTDHSAALVQQCEEVQTGQWLYLDEPRVGKFYAMQMGTRFCRERFAARYIGFLDADSYGAEHTWIRHSVDLVSAASDHLGYTYSPVAYFGFAQLPLFAAAYEAYRQVLQGLMGEIGWLANGQGFVCATDVLTQYFQTAQVTTEIDLRCALLALACGRRPYHNPAILMSSGRRITVNSRNFAAWCFYERTFYTQKDINARTKLPLDVQTTVDDLTPDMIGRFFQRRAFKITCRHLLPFVIFYRLPELCERLREVLGVDAVQAFDDLQRDFGGRVEFLLTDRFETMIMAIERHPACTALTHRIAGMMHEQYARRASSPQALAASAQG